MPRRRRIRGSTWAPIAAIGATGLAACTSISGVDDITLAHGDPTAAPNDAALEPMPYEQREDSSVDLDSPTVPGCELDASGAADAGTCAACPDGSSCDSGRCRSTVCAEVVEDASAELACPVGMKFASVEFASYGTPTGTCGLYAASGCDAPKSVSVVSTLCVSKAQCSVPATNTTFESDPCVGQLKKLVVQITCSSE